MKRVTLFTIILLSLALLLSGCMERGNVNYVHKTVGESTVYTMVEIEDAMDVVIRHFRREFEGCTLIHLYYEEDTARNQAWAENYGDDQGIILLSSFETGPDSAGMGLNDNDTYNGWSWILTRDKGGNWNLRTWGYG